MSDANKRFDLATWLYTHQHAKAVVEDTAREIARPQPKWRATNLNWRDAERRRIMGRCESLSLMCGGKASPNEWRLYIDDLAKLKYRDIDAQADVTQR